MRIIQITDLHLDKADSYPYEIDVRKNFLDALEMAKEQDPDHLVISGDFCYLEGEPEVYRWVKEQLIESDIPYSVIPGNHDNTQMLAEHFDIEHVLMGEELFFAEKIGHKKCLFLDSSKGSHSEAQLDWIRQQLQRGDESVIIFMHHPPALIGMPFMDGKHSLKDIEVIQEIFKAYKGSIHVFCGHYHIERTTVVGNITIYTTPSTFYQIKQETVDFEVDHTRVGFRTILIDEDRLTTYVQYVDGNRVG